MKKNASKITDSLALTVFAVFAVCVLVVLLYGAGSYRALVQRGEESFRLRTFHPTTGRGFCLQRICSCRWRATC